MGMTQLPGANGLEYFSIAEELKLYFEILAEVLEPVHIGLFTVFTMILLGLIATAIFREVQKQIVVGIS